MCNYKNADNKKYLQKEIRYWRSWYLRFHRERFYKNVFEQCAKQLASTALQVGKSAEKDIGMKAIDVGKTVANDAGKKLVEKAAKRLFTPKSQVANVMVPQEEITETK